MNFMHAEKTNESAKSENQWILNSKNQTEIQ